jgi:hypothetical protein
MDAYSQYSQVKKSLIEANARINYAQTIANRDYLESLAELEKWTKRYKLALENNRHDLISSAKFQMEKYEAIAKRLSTLCNKEMPNLDNIHGKLNYLAIEVNNTNKNSIHMTSISDNHTSLNEPQFIIESAIEETKKTIKLAIEKCNNLDYHRQIIQDKANQLHIQSLEHLKNQDDDLVIQKIISRKIRSEVAEIVAVQIKRQQEMVELLKNNLKTLEEVKLRLSIATPDDFELGLLRKQLDEM